ncbi:MAG: hypothetical protein JNL01_01175 [Bdellovibrionales bacterium]|nr:hypothetical protein [Bdellovibrionales bacterium]
MMVKRRARTFALISLICLFGMVFGQSTALSRDTIKHPRVGELEEYLRRVAENHVQGRFPNQPHSIRVSVEPLFRYEADDGGDDSAQGEDLPGLYLSREEIRDEWDDPATSIHQLMARVRKIKVEVNLPNILSDDEVDEIKASVQAAMGLISGRDSVEIVRRQWKATENGMSLNLMLLAGLIGLMMTAAQFMIAQKSTARIATALKGININTSSNVASVAGGLGGGGGGGSSGGGGGGGASAKGEDAEASDVNMLDPMKMRDVVVGMIGALEKDPCFPTLADILALDDLGTKNVRRMGVILDEFSANTRNKLFSYGTSASWWIDSFYMSGGQVDYIALMTLQKLVRAKRVPEEAAWNQLLTLVWRMEDRLVGFMKDIGEKRAIPILAALPKSVSVPVAKKAFPGSWGILLNPALPEDKLAEKDIADVIERAMKLNPLRDPMILSTYKKERELLGFLNQAEPKEEEEIYAALPESSNIFRLRPPFFRFFNQSRDVIKKVTKDLDLDRIAVALYGVDATLRMKVLEVLNEKQSFMVTEKVTKFEKNPPDPKLLSQTRLQVGALVEDILEKQKRSGEEEAPIADETAEGESTEAASEESTDDSGDDSGDQQNAA